MNQLRQLPILMVPLGLVVALGAPLSQAEPTTAAALDWVVDTSGTYLCQGYYSPPPLMISDEPETLNAEADLTDYDGTDRVILEGNAALNRDDFQLEADRISFLNSTGDGDAEGNVRIRRPGSLLVGDTASVNVRTNAFDLRNSSFITHDNRLRGESEFAIGAPNGDIRIVDGTMTFCAPGVNSWDLRANRIFLNQSSGRGFAEGVTVRVKEMPIFYTPILGFPLDERRLTGFLYPSFSLGSSSGTEVVTPFYWNLDPAYDLTIQPRFMTARGTALGLHGRYLFDDYSLLDIKTEQLPGDSITGTDRHSSRITFNSDPAHAFIWQMNYEDASDSEYQTDLDNFADLTDEHQLTSSVSASLRGDKWSASWLVDRVDVIDPSVEPSEVKFSRQPEVSASWADKIGNTRLSIRGGLTEFSREAAGLEAQDASEGQRFASDFKVETTWQKPYGSLTPGFLGFARWSEATTISGTQDSTYFTSGVALDSQLVFDKPSENGGLHTLTPRAKFLAREPSSDPSQIRFDTPDEAVTETVGQIFLDNPISGGDFVGDTREIALSMTARGLNPVGEEVYRASIGRTLYLADRTVTLSGTPETHSQGPLVADSTLRLSEHAQWNTRIRTKNDTEQLQSATHELKYQYSDTDYLTHRVVWTDEAATRTDVYASKQITMQWRALAGFQWEPHTEERVNQIVGFEYESCCWRAALVHAYERDQVDATNSGYSVKVQLELKGLGALGQGASNLLDRLLEGYEASESRY